MWARRPTWTRQRACDTLNHRTRDLRVPQPVGCVRSKWKARVWVGYQRWRSVRRSDALPINAGWSFQPFNQGEFNETYAARCASDGGDIVRVHCDVEYA